MRRPFGAAATLLEPDRDDSRLRVERHHSSRVYPGSPEDDTTGPPPAALGEGVAPRGARPAPDCRRSGAAFRAPQGARAPYRRVRWPRPAAHAAVDPLAPRALRHAAD